MTSSTFNNYELESRNSAVVALNNRGVNCLANFRYKDAVSCFSKGLALAKQSLLHFETICETKTSSEVSTPTGHFHQADRKPLYISNKFEDHVAGDQPFVFTRPIFISEESSVKETSSSYFVELSFMMLYNLALCHHLYALSSSSDDEDTETTLQKALSLYELAYRVLSTEDTDATVLHQMVIVNNLGHVHAQLQNVECSRQCFENLLSTIMLVKDCGEADSVQDMDGFLSNTLALMNTGCQFAAAA
jgi:tetratricopeptide (TPR) repeat protein